MSKTKLFAVVGNPVAHSLSPQMQNAAFDEMGIDAVYFRILAKSAQDALFAAREIGLSGFNSTSPFKEDFARLVDVKSPEVNLLGACNTVVFRKGKTYGYNTDPDGAVGAIKDSGIRLGGKKAVVIGAGGAGRAAMLGLAKEGARTICANRTVEKAKAAASRLGCEFCSTGSQDLERAIPGASIVVSCVTSHERIVPAHLLKRGMAVFDASYSGKSRILNDAKKNGCMIIDPRLWLVFQGPASFERLSGKRADVAIMKEAAFEKIPDARKRRKIALIGFMGSGKSTVGKIISEKTGLAFVQTDEIIEKRAGMGIPKIFEELGEPEFRRMEVSALRQALARKNCVVSCGGGIILLEENVKALQKECFVVWLYASPKEIFERIKDDKSRPLLNRPDREEVARRMLQKRFPIYAKACHVMINTDGKSPQEIAGMIMKEIGIAKAGN